MKFIGIILIVALIVGSSGCATRSTVQRVKPELTVKSFSFIGPRTTLQQAFHKIGSSGQLVTSGMHTWYCYRLSDGTDVQIIVSNFDPSSSIEVVIHQDATGHWIETLYSKKEI